MHERVSPKLSNCRTPLHTQWWQDSLGIPQNTSPELLPHINSDNANQMVKPILFLRLLSDSTVELLLDELQEGGGGLGLSCVEFISYLYAWAAF